MRITNQMMVKAAMSDLGKLRAQYAKAQDMVNGRVLSRPSEDPIRVVEAMDLNGVKLRLERAQKAGEDARNWLLGSEAVLTTVLDGISAARDTAVSAGNPANLNSDAREALAQTVLSIRESLINQLNTRQADQYLFAGTKTDTKPFSLNNGAASYAGNAGEMVRDVTPGISVVANVTGDQLVAGGDFIQTLTTMADDLRAGRTSEVLSQRMEELQTSFRHLTTVRSDLGLRQQRVEQYEAYAQSALLDVEERLQNVTGSDLETAVLRMTEAQLAYQTALASFAKALPNSLLDYMR